MENGRSFSNNFARDLTADYLGFTQEFIDYITIKGTHRSGITLAQKPQHRIVDTMLLGVIMVETTIYCAQKYTLLALFGLKTAY